MKFHICENKIISHTKVVTSVNLIRNKALSLYWIIDKPLPTIWKSNKDTIWHLIGIKNIYLIKKGQNLHGAEGIQHMWIMSNITSKTTCKEKFLSSITLYFDILTKSTTKWFTLSKCTVILFLKVRFKNKRTCQGNNKLDNYWCMKIQ